MKTERPSEIQTAFDIEFCWYMTQAAFASDGLRHGLESFGSNKNRVRAYRTHTLHLNLKVCVARSGRVRGVATHAADRGAGYGLLFVRFPSIAVPAQHLAVLFNRFPTFTPRCNVIAFHFRQFKFLFTVWANAFLSFVNLLFDAV